MCPKMNSVYYTSIRSQLIQHLLIYLFLKATHGHDLFRHKKVIKMIKQRYALQMYCISG